MPNITLPAINQDIAMQWTEQDQNLYNTLPFYMAVKQVKRRKLRAKWSKYFGTFQWKPNMGDYVKFVRKEPSPVMRQQAFPALLSGPAKKDIMDVREVTRTAYLKHHKFESPIFQFYPSFRDFFKDHVEKHATDIMEKQEIYENMFLRSFVFHQSPRVYLCGAASPIVEIAPGEGNEAGTSGKTTAWLQAQLPNVKSGLTLRDIKKAVSIMSEDFGVLPYNGEQAESLQQGLTETWVLHHSTESYGQFIDDPSLQTWKSTDMNFVTETFKGKLFGQVVCEQGRYPMRIKADGTLPQPETRIVDPNAWNNGESIVSPEYKACEYEVGFLIGERGYEMIESGPPPAKFSSSKAPDGFGGMDWNGKLVLTNKFLIPDGNGGYEMDAYNEYLRYVSHVTYGAIGYQQQNILPIIYKRVPSGA